MDLKPGAHGRAFFDKEKVDTNNKLSYKLNAI